MVKKRNSWIVMLLILMVLTTSCRKANERSCFKSIGEEVYFTQLFETPFDSLYLYDDLEYRIVQDADKAGIIELKGGENVLSFVEVKEGNNRLTISNENKCKFLRSFHHQLFATIYVDTLNFIRYEGSRTLKTKNTLHSDDFIFYMREGAGTATLTLDVDKLEATIGSGFGDFILKGKANTAMLNLQSNSFCDTRQLTVNYYLNAISSTVGNVVLNADQTHFVARINNRGNIKYIGTPNTLEVYKNGSGKLIHLNE